MVAVEATMEGAGGGQCDEGITEKGSIEGHIERESHIQRRTTAQK